MTSVSSVAPVPSWLRPDLPPKVIDCMNTTKNLSPEVIEREIRALVESVSTHRQSQQEGASFAPPPPSLPGDSESTPIGQSLRRLFSHVQGEGRDEDINYTCQFIAQTLW